MSPPDGATLVREAKARLQQAFDALIEQAKTVRTALEHYETVKKEARALLGDDGAP
jgi:chaperonin cofactor prefoldin